MSNPTTPFSWQMPTNTDLVTDLPADFEVFGQAVATSMADLLGGTTGQVLSKTSNADMDFTWTSPNPGDITGVTAGVGITGGGTSGNVTITNDMATTITTAGDLIYGTGSGTYTRRAIGSTGNVLTVSGGVPVWSAPAGGGKILQVIQGTTTTQVTVSGTTFADSGLTATITPTLANSKVLAIVSQQLQFESASSSTVNFMGYKLFRDATAIVEEIANNRDAHGFYISTASAVLSMAQMISFSYLDSPATTSATTYKIQVAHNQAGGAINCQQISTKNRSMLILMEVGA